MFFVVEKPQKNNAIGVVQLDFNDTSIRYLQYFPYLSLRFPVRLIIKQKYHNGRNDDKQDYKIWVDAQQSVNFIHLAQVQDVADR